MLYKRMMRPYLFRKDAEEAHGQVIRWVERLGSHPLLADLARRHFSVDNPLLEQELWGLRFKNPVGLAAGMDKFGTAASSWPCFGFGFIELGGFTPLPQVGNQELPRMHRLLEDFGIINKMGFNNPGAVQAAENLLAVGKIGVPVLCNLGKGVNTPLEKAAADYAESMRVLFHLGDGFVANVSSPNTPGLRTLQNKEHLDLILCEMQAVRDCLGIPRVTPKPLFVKVSPDISFPGLDEVLEVITARKVEGIIATNTTMERPQSLRSPNAKMPGGLSGQPLRNRSTEVIRYIRENCPHLPIIGVGGIFSAEDAWEKIRAGATLVQMYTGLVYEGPDLTKKVNRGIVQRLKDLRMTLSEYTALQRS